jgi:hypothetical protein
VDAFLNGSEVEYMETSKWGYERPFCSDCIYHCYSCEEDYVSEMRYLHEDCKTDEDPELESENEKDQRQDNQ